MKKPVIFAAVIAVIALVGGYFFLMPMLQGTPATVDDEEDELVAEKRANRPRRAAEPELVWHLPERVLNLSTVQATPRYARFQLALEFARPPSAKPATKPREKEGKGTDASAAIDPALEPVVARSAMIDDALVRVFTTMTAEELTTTEGKEVLKAKVLDAVAELVPSPELVNVYILRLVVQ